MLGMFDNGITIVSTDVSYTFSGFENRDEVYSILESLWSA
jgi:hypothetical protein